MPTSKYVLGACRQQEHSRFRPAFVVLCFVHSAWMKSQASRFIYGRRRRTSLGRYICTGRCGYMCVQNMYCGWIIRRGLLPTFHENHFFEYHASPEPGRLQAAVAARLQNHSSGTRSPPPHSATGGRRVLS